MDANEQSGSSEEMAEGELLENIYRRALDVHETNGSSPVLPEPYAEYAATILENQERRRAVLSVVITLLLKKLHDPSQDIRRHQSQIEGGFSGRGLDTRVVTPFLMSNQFPHMRESGWLTRSLEQAHPYDLNYPGRISPADLKRAFLGLLDGVQNRNISAEDALLTIFVGLIAYRDKNVNLVLSRPINLSIAQVIDKLSQHHAAQIQGAARLPVISLYSALTILARETSRYSGCTVLPLEQHTAPDSRSNLTGDINILDANGSLFESYEIKHNIPITSDLIQASYEKLQTTPVKRFYLLTTAQREDYSEFAPDIQMIAQSHGCQFIVNGVDRTLLYYLRLLEDPSDFVDAYVTNLEADASITFALKERWNTVVMD